MHPQQLMHLILSWCNAETTALIKASGKSISHMQTSFREEEGTQT